MKSKKEEVFQEAALLFQEKGYAAASMRELAKRVGLKQASSLYNHYKHKEEILQQICFENAHKFINGIKTIEADATSSTEKIKALIRLHIDIATQDISSVTVFNDEWRHLTEPHLSSFLVLRKAYEERFKKIVKQGMQDGDFRALDPTITFYTLLNSIKWIHHKSHLEKEADKIVLQNNITTFLLKGLQQD